MKHVLLAAALGCVAAAQPLQAQTPTPPSRQVINSWLVGTEALLGRQPNLAMGNPGYWATGLHVAHRNLWQESDADYSTTFTVGLRGGFGNLTGDFRYPILGNTRLWGLNPYAAADGRYFGGSFGIWVGKLGYYRELQAVRFVPQLRVRGGRLDSWHAQLDYAHDLTGLGNPSARLGAGRGFGSEGQFRLLVGVAFPTSSYDSEAAQLFGQAYVALGDAWSISAYYQPPFRIGQSPTQGTLQLARSF
ncbi:hypothetical protein [Solirubrum puertoriconensis]|uniref:Cellulose biosynthesis protein BcsS n=1 Tax=Solirubrum puertoriconensis TaxID=1751427 RepID=A0A9X0HJP0_SOLP1|nr:hypothetical protein [Solirubrum puertoriconensis]KUG07201.1 hypothetical protein ASU33_12570 [Solirubrum puertoriconensis]